MHTLKSKRSKFTLIIVWIIFFLSCLNACSSKEHLIETPQTENYSINQYSAQTEKEPILSKKLSIGEYLRFDNFSVEDGLSQSTVFSIVQDNQGFIWFGTEDGLNKFDGYSFTVYKNDPEDQNSLSSNWIQSILLDNSGILWIGTRDGVLNRYDRDLDHFTQFRFDSQDHSSLNDDEITKLYLDQEGFIWIGTTQNGLEKFDPLTGEFENYQSDPRDTNSLSDNYILSIYQSSDGILWIGTNGGGLNSFDQSTETFIHYKNIPDDSFSLIDNFIWSIFEDTDNHLWIGTNAGLDKFDRETQSFTHFRNDPDDAESISYDVIHSIYEDISGSLWVGTYGGGLNYFNKENQLFSRYQNLPGDSNSISSDIILSIFQDREGVLWFGTIGGGVNKLDLGRVNFTQYKHNPTNPNSLSNDMVRAFFQDPDQSIWIGTMFGGLNHFDPKTQKWQNYRNDPNDPSSLSDDFVSTIYRDRSGVLWVGTIHGLDRFNEDKKTFSHFNVNQDYAADSSRIEVTAIYESQDGDFWIGTTDGLYQFDRKGEVWKKETDLNLGNTQNLYVYIILGDSNGGFYIGTLGTGLYIYNPKTGDFSHFQNDPENPESLINNYITSMIMDQSGYLWVGTNNNGLDKFDQNLGTFTHFREIDGLPNDSIYCMLEDRSGHIWISTNNGLSRFDPRTESFTNYNMTDGLQSNEFNAKACLRTRNGEMVFGGINGFNILIPEDIQNNPVSPPVVVSSISMNNEKIKLESSGEGYTEIKHLWPLDNFEFDYAALSFAQPENNQYAYFLEGFEETWKDVGNRRFGQYTNLPAGNYTLRVIGSNNDGVWNEIGVAIPITVVPQFWQTPWFLGIVIVAISGGIYGGYRFRVRNLKIRERDLENQVQERTSELMKIQSDLKQIEMDKAITEERNRLARDLHDSVTQSIYSLTLLAEAGQRLIRKGNLIEAEGIQNRLGDIAQQVLQEMRLLVYELRPKTLQHEGLEGALEHRLESVERRAGIKAQLSVDLSLKLTPNIEDELYKISMEALNNALKHSKTTEVVLSIHNDENFLFLMIEDNGKGFNPEFIDSKGGVGLTSMTERAEKMGGTFNIQSKPGKGTKILVQIPLKSLHQQLSGFPKESHDI